MALESVKAEKNGGNSMTDDEVIKRLRDLLNLEDPRQFESGLADLLPELTLPVSTKRADAIKNFRAPDSGHTLLHECMMAIRIHSKAAEIGIKLLQIGLSPNDPEAKYGDTPIHKLCRVLAGSPKVADSSNTQNLLSVLTADYKEAFRKKNNWDKTPLDLLMSQQHIHSNLIAKIGPEPELDASLTESQQALLRFINTFDPSVNFKATEFQKLVTAVQTEGFNSKGYARLLVEAVSNRRLDAIHPLSAWSSKLNTQLSDARTPPRR